MENIKILVPTDFSDCAQNALDYALHIAKDINAEILLIHSINSDLELLLKLAVRGLRKQQIILIELLILLR